MSDAPASRPDDPADDSANDSGEGGVVSEVANLGEGEPISPDQSVAAAPGDESEGVQEGRQGPNAVTGDESEPGRDLGARAEERGRQDPVETDDGD